MAQRLKVQEGTKDRTEWRSKQMQREYIGGEEGLVCVPSFSTAVLYDFPCAARRRERTTVNDESRATDCRGTRRKDSLVERVGYFNTLRREDNQRHSAMRRRKDEFPTPVRVTFFVRLSSLIRVNE